MMNNLEKLSTTNLDEVDWQLLELLQQNGKLTTKELAQNVHLSPTPVYERIKRLEKNGIIKKYVALLDADSMGKSMIVFCNVTLKEHTRKIGNQFVKDIKSLKEVTECYNISGDYDFLLKIMVRDMKHYQDFVINSLGSIKNIGSAHSTFVMGVIKHSTEIPM